MSTTNNDRVVATFYIHALSPPNSLESLNFERQGIQALITCMDNKLTPRGAPDPFRDCFKMVRPLYTPSPEGGIS